MNFSFFYHFGRYVSMLAQGFTRPEKFSMYWKETVRQMEAIGVGSIIIVVLISVFIGAVSALQFCYQLDGQLVPMYYVGYIARDLAIIESAPTITCLVLAGKVGSNIAAEIGGMRQKEHIDAMEIMGVNTSAYLVTPKIVAAIFVIPMLVTLAAMVGIIGGYLASVPAGYLTDMEYMRGLRAYFVPYNVFIMYVKAIVFAFLITSISSYFGYFVTGGSIELGKASTNAVVIGNIFILAGDYFIALLLT